MVQVHKYLPLQLQLQQFLQSELLLLQAGLETPLSIQKNVKATTATIKDLNATQQVLIVKITGEDNSVVAKKVII